jgi:hypothetical protein
VNRFNPKQARNPKQGRTTFLFSTLERNRGPSLILLSLILLSLIFLRRVL